MKKYLFLLIFVSFNAIAQTGFTKSDWKNQLETEKLFNNLIDDTRFKIHLKELTKNLMLPVVSPTMRLLITSQKP